MNENFESVKNIIINENKLMIKDKFPVYMMNRINSKLIKHATKLYKFDKKQITELKQLANLN